MFCPRAKSASEIVSLSSTASSGTPRRDPPRERQLDHVPVENFLAHRLRQLRHLDRPALVVAAPDESLFLERREMLVHRRERRQLQRVRDLLEARRVAVLVDKADQVVQDFFLPFRQRHLSPIHSPAFARLSPPARAFVYTSGDRPYYMANQKRKSMVRKDRCRPVRAFGPIETQSACVASIDVENCDGESSFCKSARSCRIPAACRGEPTEECS